MLDHSLARIVCTSDVDPYELDADPDQPCEVRKKMDLDPTNTKFLITFFYKSKQKNYLCLA